MGKHEKEVKYMLEMMWLYTVDVYSSVDGKKEMQSSLVVKFLLL